MYVRNPVNAFKRNKQFKKDKRKHCTERVFTLKENVRLINKQIKLCVKQYKINEVNRRDGSKTTYTTDLTVV